jgi:xanthine dehydrogenase accessory factor
VKEIRNILRLYDSIDPTKEKVALASVVHIEESSYRRIGARMLVTSSGRWIGGISGGCLEGDALRRSQQAIFKNTSSLMVYDTLEEDQHQIGIGLGCNGRVEVLLTPIDPAKEENEIELLRQIVEADQPSILLKVIEAPKTPHLAGHSQLIHPAGDQAEFAGIEKIALSECLGKVLQKKRPMVFPMHSSQHGPLRILVEFIRPEIRLIIVGDNYDVNAMTGIASELGWDIYIVGKSKKLSKEVFQRAKQVLDYSRAHELQVHEYTAVILMTHDFEKDKGMLPVFVEKQPPYIGMLGPKKRFQKMDVELVDLNLEAIDFIFSPTGLEIGAESPQEIALSITSEIIAKFRNKEGRSLHEKKGTIHERE